MENDQARVIGDFQGCHRVGTKVSSTERSGSEWARVEWNYSGIGEFDNKRGNNLGLSSCAVP